jgi:hypothetical protein
MYESFDILRVLKTRYPEEGENQILQFYSNNRFRSDYDNYYLIDDELYIVTTGTIKSVIDNLYDTRMNLDYIFDKEEPDEVDIFGDRDTSAFIHMGSQQEIDMFEANILLTGRTRTYGEYYFTISEHNMLYIGTSNTSIKLKERRFTKKVKDTKNKYASSSSSSSSRYTRKKPVISDSDSDSDSEDEDFFVPKKKISVTKVDYSKKKPIAYKSPTRPVTLTKKNVVPDRKGDGYHIRTRYEDDSDSDSDSDDY